MNWWGLFGYASTSFHHSPNSIELETTPDRKRTNLAELCKAATPICHLNPFLFNGHLQTVWTTVSSQEIPIYYRRKIFDAEDPAVAGIFAVDFTVSPYHETDKSLPPRTTYYNDKEVDELGCLDTKPMLIALHGLSGGSHEIYLRSVLEPILDEGWEACVINSRGCAKSSITSGVLYNARATWDMRQVVKWLRIKFPNRPLFGIGFSLGANILVNYLGEEGSSCALKAAVVCSNPWNLDIGSAALQRTWLGLEVYSRAMGSNMKNLFDLHIEELSKNTRVDIAEVRKATYLHEFDRVFQGPTWGYPTEGAYYRDASCCDSLLAVRIPLFAINAEDDPIAAREALPLQEIGTNPFVVLCTTSTGGHLGWFESGGGRWFAKPVARFLARMAKSVDLTKIPKASEEDPLIVIHQPNRVSSFEPMRRKLQVIPKSNIDFSILDQK